MIMHFDRYSDTALTRAALTSTTEHENNVMYRTASHWVRQNNKAVVKFCLKTPSREHLSGKNRIADK